MILSFVNELPLIEVWDDVFSEQTANEVIHLASQRLKPSEVVDYDSRTSRPSFDSYRTSYDAVFQFSDMKHYPHLFFPIIEKIETITGYPRNHFELPTVIRYDQNQMYQQHTDLYADELLNEDKRVATVVMYLNDVIEDGSTEFNNLGIKIFPKVGRLLYFNYDSQNESILQSTTHTGNSPGAGYKWITSVWIKSTPQVSVDQLIF
jgi:prolyl 4-hydroxylase